MPWLFLAYPFLVHAAIVTGYWQLEFAAIMTLAALAMSNALITPRLWAWIALLVVGLCAFWATIYGHGISFLYFPPVLLPLMLLILFGRSLQAGKTPLVTKIATIMRDNHMTPELTDYCRRVTILWCITFAAIPVISIVLAVAGPSLWWSLFTNFISYGLVTVIFVVEYGYRQHKYGDEHELNWRQFARRMFKVDYRDL